MKLLFKTAVLLTAVCLFAGCAMFKPGRARVKKPNSRALVYSGPKARVVIADFDLKSSKATSEAGSGLRQTLASALTESRRFTVLEHQNKTGQKQEAQDPSLVPTKEQVQEATLQNKEENVVISASVTEFEPQASGGSSGVGGGGGAGSGVLGGLLGAPLNKAHMALEIRVLDAETSKVLGTTRIQGQASDINSKAMTGLSSGSLSGGLSAYANTTMEKAIRICIIEAARYITEIVPAEYYKY